MGMSSGGHIFIVFYFKYQFLVDSGGGGGIGPSLELF